MTSELVIIGAGEIGRRFAAAAGAGARVLRRGFTRDELGAPGTPVLLCVREQQLEGALAAVPVARSEDLVFVQNGFVDETLARYPGHGRAVLWFTAKGSFFREIFASPVAGPHADRVAALLAALGLRASVDSIESCRRAAAEKGAWSCVVGPALSAWKLDFATAMRTRRDDCYALSDEACAVARAALQIDADPSRARALLDETVDALGWMTGGAHALAQRNGWVSSRAQALLIAAPVNDAVVRALAG